MHAETIRILQALLQGIIQLAAFLLREEILVDTVPLIAIPGLLSILVSHRIAESLAELAILVHYALHALQDILFPERGEKMKWKEAVRHLEGQVAYIFKPLGHALQNTDLLHIGQNKQPDE